MCLVLFQNMTNKTTVTWKINKRCDFVHTFKCIFHCFYHCHGNWSYQLRSCRVWCWYFEILTVFLHKQEAFAINLCRITRKLFHLKKNLHLTLACIETIQISKFYFFLVILLCFTVAYHSTLQNQTASSYLNIKKTFLLPLEISLLPTEISPVTATLLEKTRVLSPDLDATFT